MLSEVQNNIGLPDVFQSTFSKVYLISESALLANPYTLSLSPSPSKMYFFVFKPLKIPPSPVKWEVLTSFICECCSQHYNAMKMAFKLFHMQPLEGKL